MIDNVINFLEKLKKEKTYNINELYIGDIGKVEVTWPGDFKIHGKFNHNKFAIMTEATKKEKYSAFKKYGTAMGTLTYANAPNFISANKSIDCYKILSNNKILPESSISSVIDNTTYAGVYEIVRDVIPLSMLNQGTKTCKIDLPEKLTLEEILDLEKQLNNEYQMSM